MFTATELRPATQTGWLHALMRQLRDRAERLARERLARRTLRSLSHLDAHTLRDIGLDASELSSAALEVARRIEATRWHIWSPQRARC
ncbi:MAG: DUF1127 domain-containing protein [Pseudomonadota bacterium]